MTTAIKENVQKRITKEVKLSDKAIIWCQKVAKVAAKRAFRVKALSESLEKFDPDKTEFFFLPKIYHRKRISYHAQYGGTLKIFLHPDFFDEKGNIRKKLPRNLREELKAAIYKEVAHFAFERPNIDFYKIMIRCPWTGKRVDGAVGSKTPARKILSERKQKKLKRKRKVVEEPTGLQEDVLMWDLTSGQKVLVKNADIFLADGRIKIARGTYNGKKLRTMLPGGAKLKAKLG